MIKKVLGKQQGYRTQDGAGVSLVRVLGNDNTKDYDPFLMFDAFDSTDPRDYESGFPMHPHRGIETLTYMARGGMLHRDHLGNESLVTDGEAQWLTAGSGAFHEEMPRASERMLGAQLWLNLPAKDKMTAPPAYHAIRKDEIREFPFEGGFLRLITGQYRGEQGYQGKYLPMDYYDVHLEPHASLHLDLAKDSSTFIFTLLGSAVVSGTEVEAKTAARLGEGDEVTLETGEEGAEILVITSKHLGESIAWYGPIVMNTRAELEEAVRDLQNGTFIKEEERYENQ